MPLTRQDAWSQDEDLLLAEIVLRNIREGGTQLKAFEEVGKQLTRTAAACGFRWNSCVRKQYKSGIELAKKQRKEAKKHPDHPKQEDVVVTADEPVTVLPEKEEVQTTLSLHAVKQYLDELYEKADGLSGSKESLEDNKERIRDLEKQIYYLSAENEKLETQLKAMEEDYLALSEIMERARRRAEQKEEQNQQKVKFQIDSKGNLEKIETS